MKFIEISHISCMFSSQLFISFIRNWFHVLAHYVWLDEMRLNFLNVHWLSQILSIQLCSLKICELRDRLVLGVNSWKLIFLLRYVLIEMDCNLNLAIINTFSLIIIWIYNIVVSWYLIEYKTSYSNSCSSNKERIRDSCSFSYFWMKHIKIQISVHKLGNYFIMYFVRKVFLPIRERWSVNSFSLKLMIIVIKYREIRLKNHIWIGR